jgi:hypothetical protein
MTIPQSFAFGKIQPGYPFVVFDDISPDRGIFFAQGRLSLREKLFLNIWDLKKNPPATSWPSPL